MRRMLLLAAIIAFGYSGRAAVQDWPARPIRADHKQRRRHQRRLHARARRKAARAAGPADLANSTASWRTYDCIDNLEAGNDIEILRLNPKIDLLW